MTEFAAATENEVVDAVRAARSAASALEVVGARSKRALGRKMETGLDLLDLSGLGGITLYEPDELIVTARPATPVAEIAAALAEKGQRLGFDPPDFGPLLGAAAGIGTIGGAISVDACGAGRMRYGAVRDHLLGIRAVNGLGEAFKAGGKVVKNVTGFDIPKLFCGAFGTLGVLTEVTLRVFPRPTCTQVLVVREMAPEDGLALLRRLWSGPLEPTGLAFADGTVLVRLDGEAGPLAEKTAMLGSACSGREVQTLDGGEAAFGAISNGSAFLDTPQSVWRISVPPSSAYRFIQNASLTRWTADWAGGLVWAASDDHGRLRAAAAEAGGHAVLMRGGASLPDGVEIFAAEDPVRAKFTRAVKGAFDPAGLFNPGRMWDGV